MGKQDKPREGLSATELLRADHTKIKGLFDEFESADDERSKKNIVETTLAELIIHDKLEEEIFYPAAREAIEDDELLDEAAEQHHIMKLLMTELAPMEPGDDKYDAKFMVMSEAVRRHLDEEEGELFPQVEESQSDLMELGQRLQKRKEELVEQAIKPAEWAREGAGPSRRREGARRIARRSRRRATAKGRRVPGGRRAGKGKTAASKR